MNFVGILSMLSNNHDMSFAISSLCAMIAFLFTECGKFSENCK